MIFSDLNLSQKLERTEARSNAAFVEARTKMFPESLAEWTQIGGAYAMFDGAKSPLTQTFGLGIFETATDDILDEIEDFFRKYDAPIFHEVSPLADVSTLDLLNRRGYQPCELTSVMFQPIDKKIYSDVSTNSELNIRIVRTDEAEIWAQTSASGWATEMEGLYDFMFEFGKISARCAGGFPFLAELEGKPISTGMLFIYDGVAILAGASTIPEGRRRGAQSALLNARLKFAAENGCTLAIMCALPGSQSQRNAEKNNFRIAYTRTKWQLKK